MPESNEEMWLESIKETVSSYREMILETIEQLSDQELVQRPGAEFNSVAVLLRHLSGNLQSRWTDFLTTDGEKPDRDRDREFMDWEGDRSSLMAYFEQGWTALESAIDSLNSDNLSQTILIRGESHSIPEAIMRSITHLSYHVGQISLIARMVHSGQWKWLTIAPGGSSAHNESTWGTPASRSVLSNRPEGDES